ncbi:MAG TPA: polysaccharide deacetylase family protein [Roseiflexaceae bacterium]|nr:polysaccharide deacetylase family protein [Roseiflexaceae bacterium]
MRRGLILVLLAVAAAAAGGALLIGRRLDQCQAVPLIGANLLPNAALAPAAGGGLPQGWSALTSGVELQGPAATPGRGFDLDGDGRALQLLGIANYVETPPFVVRPGQSYCFSGRALTDSVKGSPTRLQPVFRWLDAAGAELAADAGAWQPVVLWTKEAPPAAWSELRAAFRAPPGASALVVRIRTASDDRVYLDAMQARWTLRAGTPVSAEPPAGPRTVELGGAAVTLLPWPEGASAALSFSFDWETAMGGLVHSRSLKDDPYSDEDPVLRGMRMRQGVTTTLELFRPYGIRATYYANGYNFLDGNAARRTFMGDPTFAWATRGNGWPADWSDQPWFGPDPYGTVASEPAWYFGDLLARLRAEGQDIQSHTFSHLYGGYASPAEWQADLEAWNALAAERGLPPARSLAFPWSGNAGMSDSDWRLLEQAGITSVTRTNRSQRLYQITRPEDPYCRPVPGHAAILACPDFYLTASSALTATALLERVIARGGMIDLWAHTEEVVAPGQVEAWGRVVAYAAGQRDAGRLWIAPLAEIADWQQALGRVELSEWADAPPAPGAAMRLRIVNNSDRPLDGLTLALPFRAVRAESDSPDAPPSLPAPDRMRLRLAPGQTLRVTLWL